MLKSTFKTLIDPVAKPANKYLQKIERENVLFETKICFLFLLVIVRQRQGSDGTVESWIGVQQGKSEESPHFYDASFTGSHQVFAVTSQRNALIKGKTVQLTD